MTLEEIARVVTRGTTTKWDKVRVLFADDNIALVKWPGGYDGGRWYCRSWVSSWVDVYRIADLQQRNPHSGRQVWSTSKDGRLSKQRLVALIEMLKSLEVTHENY